MQKQTFKTFHEKNYIFWSLIVNETEMFITYKYFYTFKRFVEKRTSGPLQYQL